MLYQISQFLGDSCYDEMEDSIKFADESFRRLTGVKRTKFEKMVGLVSQALQRKKAQGGRPNKLTVQEMLFIHLIYNMQTKDKIALGC